MLSHYVMGISILLQCDGYIYVITLYDCYMYVITLFDGFIYVITYHIMWRVSHCWSSDLEQELELYIIQNFKLETFINLLLLGSD